MGLLFDPNDVDAIASGIIALLNRQGPAGWFDRQALHDAVTERFGRAPFRARLAQILGS